MSFKEAISLISAWPRDRNVPRLMKDVYKRSNKDDRIDIVRATESLYAAAGSDEDIELIQKYWN
tara:strand:- start:1110 stop:1301 length:192 start_codon:yes stop_codon:yes gene_type:complete